MDAKHEKYFKMYPKVSDFYFTTDGLAFTDANKARTHQQSIKGVKGDPLHLSRKQLKADDSQPKTK